MYLFLVQINKRIEIGQKHILYPFWWAKDKQEENSCRFMSTLSAADVIWTMMEVMAGASQAGAEVASHLHGVFFASGSTTGKGHAAASDSWGR